MPTSSTSSLSEKDHSRVSTYLTRLSNKELVDLGVRLGLRYTTLQNISSSTLLNDMVKAWLRRDDDVMDVSGEPSCESLSKALEECGITGIATEIRRNEAAFDLRLEVSASSSQYNILSPSENIQESEINESFAVFTSAPFVEVQRRDKRLGSATSQNDGSIIFKLDRQRDSVISTQPANVLPENEMMDIHVSYHRSLSGKQAEKRLKACGNHCYLTRYSEKRQSYFLTVYQKSSRPTTKHFRIEVHERKHKIQDKTKEFDTLEDLLQEYENNPIDPSFLTIGSPVTEDEWTKLSNCCTLL